jgi:gas vesicle protein
MEDDKRLPYFFLGLGIGVAVGVLFAPKSGEDTRGLIKNKALEGSDYLRRRGEELKGSATEYVERGKTVIAKQKDQLSAAMEAGKAAYREVVGDPANVEQAEQNG